MSLPTTVSTKEGPYGLNPDLFTLDHFDDSKESSLDSHPYLPPPPSYKAFKFLQIEGGEEMVCVLDPG